MSEQQPTTPASTPVAQSDYLLWRQIDRLDKRVDETNRELDRLDQQGSRGVEALRGQVAQLTTDLGKLGKELDSHERQHVISRRWTLGFTAALVTPLYPLIWAVVNHHG